MVKKSYLALILLFLIPTLLATTTEIKVKTLPSRSISIIILETGTTYDRIESFHKQSSIWGEVKVSTTSDKERFDIKLELRDDNGNTILVQRFEDNPSGIPIFINFVPDNITLISGNPKPENITINETQQANLTQAENTTTNETNASRTIPTNQTFQNLSEITQEPFKDTQKISPITGNVVNFYKNNTKTIFYIIIVIIIIAVVFFLFVFIRHKPFSKKISSAIKFRAKRINDDKELKDVEKKIKTASEELERIKKRREAILSAEKKLEEDKLLLEKLKRNRF